MPLNLTIPVFFADGGPNVVHAKGYYKTLLRAHAEEMQGTFGELTPVPALDLDTSWVASLPTPSVLVLPVLCGGWVDKDWKAWWAFRGHLRAYRSAGGVVVCLDKAFNLPADGARAAGRSWEGFQTHATLPGASGQLGFEGADGTVVATVDAHEVKARCEWKRAKRWSDSRGAPIAWLNGGDARLALGWRWAREAWEEPGVMLFLSCWGWTRVNVLDDQPWLRTPFNRTVVEAVFRAYRTLNRTIVQQQVAQVIARRQVRTRRLELLSGDTVRLPSRVGREKDYHRLLVNDAELCVDLIGWRALLGVEDGGLSSRFRTTFADAAVVNEPGHAKAKGGRGRLDILLAADSSAEELGDAYMTEGQRGPVAWIELEAGPLHLHQIENFLGGQGASLRPGDFVCTVDRSPDDAPAVKRARTLTQACGAAFIHTQVPNAFSRLEEAYAPHMHKLARKRYSLEVIRGLLG